MPVETSLSLIRDREGRVEGFRGIVRDITERVRREEAQKNELKRYIDEINDLYQNVPCGCHSWMKTASFSGSTTPSCERLAGSIIYAALVVSGALLSLTPYGGKHIVASIMTTIGVIGMVVTVVGTSRRC